MQDLSVGCSQIKGEKVQDVQRETPPDVKNIQSNAIVEHHQSRLHIWTKDNPPSEIIGSHVSIHTCLLMILTKHCHYATFMSSTELITIKYTLLNHDLIVSMQEELAEFKRNKVWKLVPKPKGHDLVGTH